MSNPILITPAAGNTPPALNLSTESVNAVHLQELITHMTGFADVNFEFAVNNVAAKNQSAPQSVPEFQRRLLANPNQAEQLRSALRSANKTVPVWLQEVMVCFPRARTAPRIQISASGEAMGAARRAATPLAENHYSTILTNAEFEDLLKKMAPPLKLDLDRALLTPGHNHTLIPNGDIIKRNKETIARYKNSITPAGKKRLAEYAYKEAYPNRLAEGFTADPKGVLTKKIEDFAIQRGIAVKRTVTKTEIGALEKGARYFSMLFTVPTLVSTAFKGVGDFNQATLDGVSTSDPSFSAVPDAEKDAAYQQTLGYNPEKTSELDRIWSEAAARGPALAMPEGNKPLKQGVIYQLHDHKFIYTGNGHIIFAPGGKVEKSYDVALYKDKEGNAWKNGKALKTQIIIYARALPQIKNVKNVVIDLGSRKIYSVGKRADIADGHDMSKAKEIKVSHDVWAKQAPKKKKNPDELRTN